MRWQLLQSIDDVVPGERIRGRATTDFPPTLFADHFPSFPVTPGVLLIEIAAQLAGLLVQATVRERRGHWVFPVLTIVREAKFRSFVPPGTPLEVEAELESLRPDAAQLRARIFRDRRRCAGARLTFAFDPAGGAHGGERRGDPAILARHTRELFRRLGGPWRPPETDASRLEGGG